MARDPVVSTAWLAERLDDPQVRVVDATWRMPGDAGDPNSDFNAARIPGAVFFDIDAVADTASPLPHMAPGPDQFAVAVGDLGIRHTDTVVIYDQIGVFSAPRAWWTFRLFGHDDVFVLDGGLPAWRAERRPIDSGPRPQSSPARYRASFRPELVRDLGQVGRLLADGGQVVDARAALRFDGVAPEPRPGLRGGHMPGALNLPFQDVVADGRLAPAETIREAFATAGVDLGRPITTTCGSGLTAAILALAAARAGREDAAIYDGSWAEWGARNDTPVISAGPGGGEGGRHEG